MTLSVYDSEVSSTKQDSCEYRQLITSHLINEIGKTRFETWFGGPNCFQITDQTVSVSAPNAFSLQRLQNRFQSDIRRVVDRVCGAQFKIEFVEASIELDSESSTADEVIHSTPEASPVKETRSKKPVRTVDSFWFGPENRLAQSSVEQTFAQPGQFSPLFIYGPTGCGKSDLLESVTNDFRRRLRRQRCVYLSAEQFTNYFVQALRGGKGLPVFRRKYRDLDLLAVDDIQFLAGKKATIAEFQFTIDYLNRIGKQVILSSDRPPVELTNLSPDLTARLTSGLICPLQYPGFEGRVEIAKRMCSSRNFSIPTPVLEHVCDQIRSDVRRLSGAVNRIHAARIATGRQVTIESANQFLADLFAISNASASLMGIEKAVCDLCQISPNELKSPSRKRRVCTARMLAMYLSRQHTSSAFSEIGDYYGGRSHSTVIAAQKKVGTWLADNQSVNLPHSTYLVKELIERIETTMRVG